MLIADHLVHIRQSLQALLASWPEIEVVGMAANNVEIAQRIEKYQPDVVLMDINFPSDPCNGGMGSWDGFQIMYWLRGLPTAKGARFIMVSNSDSAAYRKRAHELGAEAYFQKPLNFDQLFEAVNAGN